MHVVCSQSSGFATVKHVMFPIEKNTEKTPGVSCSPIKKDYIPKKQNEGINPSIIMAIQPTPPLRTPPSNNGLIRPY